MWRVCGRREVCTGFWWGNVWERDHLEDTAIDGRMILRWIFRKNDVRARTGMVLIRAGICEYSNKPSDAIKCGVFFE
jgi:hypothetical protein